MTGQRELVVGLFRKREDARDALAALRSAGFGAPDVSLLSPSADSTGAADGTGGTGGDSGDHAGTVATGSAVAGGLLGGLAGWLIGTGALVIPGVGPFVAAGALAAALGGAAIGAGVGAVAGALVGLGLTDEEARWYEQEVRGGATLVTVRAGGRQDQARDLLRRSGAYDIETEDPQVLRRGTAGVTSTDRTAASEERAAAGAVGPEGPASAARASSATAARGAPAAAPASDRSAPGAGYAEARGTGRTGATGDSSTIAASDSAGDSAGAPGSASEPARPGRDFEESRGTYERFIGSFRAQRVAVFLGAMLAVGAVWWLVARRRRPTVRDRARDTGEEALTAVRSGLVSAAESLAPLAAELKQRAALAGETAGDRGRLAARRAAAESARRLEDAAALLRRTARTR